MSGALRILPLSPTIAAVRAAAEADLDAAYEATQVAHEAVAMLAKARFEAHPHPQFAAWGSGWTRRWAAGEYEARAAEMLAAFDAAYDTERRRIEGEETAAGVAYARALARWQALTPR